MFQGVDSFLLHQLGEEGETPASDEIWLAVEDEVGGAEDGFLSSSSSDDEVTTVETDRLSTTANLAGHTGDPKTGHVDAMAFSDLTDRLARMEEMIFKLSSSMDQNQEGSRRLEALLIKMDLLPMTSTEDTSSLLKKENQSLKEQLQDCKERESKLTAKVEEMELKLQRRKSLSSEASEASQSDFGKSLSNSAKLLPKRPSRDNLILGSNSNESKKPPPKAPFSDREKQLMDRNKELEEKILKRKSTNSKLSDSLSNLKDLKGEEDMIQRTVSLDAEDWRLTIVSKQDMQLLSSTPNALIVSSKSPEPKAEKSTAMQTEAMPEPQVKAKPVSTSSKPTLIPKREKVESRKPAPRPAPKLKPPVLLPPKDPPVPSKRESQTSARHDPIPQPPQYPAARPPRHHQPSRSKLSFSDPLTVREDPMKTEEPVDHGAPDSSHLTEPELANQVEQVATT